MRGDKLKVGGGEEKYSKNYSDINWSYINPPKKQEQKSEQKKEMREDDSLLREEIEVLKSILFLIHPEVQSSKQTNLNVLQIGVYQAWRQRKGKPLYDGTN